MTTFTRREFVATASIAAWPLMRAVSGQIATAGIRPPSDAFLGTLPKLMEVTAVPGLSMGVLQDGKLVWQKHEGVADASSRTPVTADSLFPAASLGKPVFAYAALKLADVAK